VNTVWQLLLILLVLLRLSSLRRMWGLPVRHGAQRFVSTTFTDDQYTRFGARLLRQYRLALFVPFVFEAAVIAILLARGRGRYLLHEQFVAMVVVTVVHYYLVFLFAARARVLAPPDTAPAPTAVQLSLEKRRLRDQSRPAVETLVAGTTLGAIAILAARHRLTAAAMPLAWVLYLQIGLLLLKQVFVHWRLKLPLRRTEDFLRWRATWLRYHMRTFDALRVLCAAGLVHIVAFRGFGPLPDIATPVAVALWIVSTLVYALYARREWLQVASVEREIRPVDLAREFPPSAIPDGRFWAGGLLYFNRDNPVILARSPSGIAINLANWSTYAWVLYLAGLGLLVSRQVVP
jgi:hypothetical protein